MESDCVSFKVVILKVDEMLTVSVIIPTFNRAGMLKEAVASVLAQDYDGIDLIVVDDGSTDDTEKVLGTLPDICVLRQRNRGVSAARNAGIKKASGTFIAFLDSDDLWLPQKLSTQINFFYEHPKACICQTEERWIRNGVRINPKRRHTKPSGMIFERAVALCLVSPSAVMMRKELFEEVGLFDETLPACEDYDLWLRISCRFPIYLIDSPMVIKRGGHDDQLSKSPGLDRFRIRALKKILDRPPKGGLTSKQRFAALKALSDKCAIYASGCFKRGRKSEGLEYLAIKAGYEQDMATLLSR
jgi:glycosyltransferase involved in cell wall biosynthesis